MSESTHDGITGSISDEPGLDIAALLAPVAARWKTVLAITLVCGVAGYGASFLIAPKFTASSMFLPPQTQGSTAGMLASLGAISGLAGIGTATKSSPDQYIALMQSATVSDRIIKKFGLKKLFNVDFDVDARKQLLASVAINAGKKDGLIAVDVTNKDPVLAAAIANQYITELRTLTNDLAVTEAQQRRVFFEHLLEQTRDKLSAAQVALESSGYSAGALNSQPQSAAETYGRLRAELTAAKVKLQVSRRSLADASPEVAAQQELVNALTSQLANLERQDSDQPRSGDYINRYREFKYQETLFDLFAKQYESARVDESREGALIQVVDPATPPERKSGPRRSLIALVSTAIGFLGASLFVAVSSRRGRNMY